MTFSESHTELPLDRPARISPAGLQASLICLGRRKPDMQSEGEGLWTPQGPWTGALTTSPSELCNTLLSLYSHLLRGAQSPGTCYFVSPPSAGRKPVRVMVRRVKSRESPVQLDTDFLGSEPPEVPPHPRFLLSPGPQRLVTSDLGVLDSAILSSDDTCSIACPELALRGLKIIVQVWTCSVHIRTFLRAKMDSLF